MITLMQFQQTAASGLADRFLTYAEDPVVTGTARKPHRVPVFQALSASNASGKPGSTSKQFRTGEHQGYAATEASSPTPAKHSTRPKPTT